MSYEIRKKIEAGVAAGHTRHVPGLVEAIEAQEAAIDVIDQSKFIESEKQLQRDAATTARDLKVAAALEAAIAAETREFDQQIGRLRAEARLQPVSVAESTLTERDIARASARQRHLHESSMTLASVASNALDADELTSLWDEAVALDHAPACRLVGSAAARRLRDLKDGEAVPMFKKRWEEAELRFAARFGAWRTAHPTPLQRIDVLERQRGQIEAVLRASASFAVGLADASRPKPVVVNPRADQRAAAERMRDSMPAASAAGMTIGPNFDRLANQE